MKKVKVVKKVKKSFKKMTKATGMNYFERKRLANAAKNYTYDVAVNVGTTLALDVIYTGVDAVSAGICLAGTKVHNLIASKKPTTTNVVIDIEEAIETPDESEA